MLRSEVATSSVENPLFMGDFGNFNFKLPKNQFFSSLTDSPLSRSLLSREELPLRLLKNNDLLLKNIPQQFPSLLFLCQHFPRLERPHLLFYFLTVQWGHPSTWLCFHLYLWQPCCRDGGVRGVVVRVMPRVLSWRHSGVTTCRAKAAQPGGHRAERCHWDAEFRSPRKWDGIWSNCLQERWASLQAGLLGSGYYGGIILLQGWRSHCAWKTSKI